MPVRRPVSTTHPCQRSGSAYRGYDIGAAKFVGLRGARFGIISGQSNLRKGRPGGVNCTPRPYTSGHSAAGYPPAGRLGSHRTFRIPSALAWAMLPVIDMGKDRKSVVYGTTAGHEIR